MKPGGPLKRKTGLRSVTKDTARRRRRFARQFGSADFVEFLLGRGCEVVRQQAEFELPLDATHVCLGTLDPAHLRPRGAGHGVLDVDGKPNVVALCRLVHDEQGLIGCGGILAEYGVDLEYGAVEAHRDWKRGGGLL